MTSKQARKAIKEWAANVRKETKRPGESFDYRRGMMDALAMMAEAMSLKGYMDYDEVRH